MVRIFLAHVCGKADCRDHILLDWLNKKLSEEKIQFEVFVSCQRNGEILDAAGLNQNLADSHIFIPIISDEYKSRPNCCSELEQARERKRETGYPCILPARLNATSAVLEELKFKINQDANEGEAWVDFSDGQTWDENYHFLLERITHFCVQKRLIGQRDFYLDIEVVNVILKHEKPTAYEIRAALDFCRMGEEYKEYFFDNLDKKEWLFYLEPFGFFQNSPAPFEPTDKPGWVRTPHWVVLPFLEKVAKKSKNPENRDAALQLVKIIRHVSALPDELSVKNHVTSWTFSKIFSELPNELIQVEDLAIASGWFDSRVNNTLVSAEIGKGLFPKFLLSNSPVDQDKAICLLRIISELKPQPRSNREGLVTAMEGYWISELFMKYAKQIGERCGLPAIDLLRDRLRQIINLNPEHDQFSYISRSAIEHSPKHFASDEPDDLFIWTLRDALLGYVEKVGAEALPIVKILLEDEYEVFQRLGIYLISQHFNLFRSLLWDALNVNRLGKNNFRHELFSLLQVHFQELSADEQKRVVDMIQNLSLEPAEGIGFDMSNAAHRLIWLEAMRDKGNQAANELYKEYLGVTGNPPFHPESASYSETMWGTIGPIEPKNLAAMPLEEIAQYLNDFIETREWKKPSEDGLANVFSEAIKLNIDKFGKGATSFKTTKVRYQIAFLQAFIEMWNKKVPIPWNEILEYCWSLIESEAFWQNPSGPNAQDVLRNRQSILYQVSGLIAAGTRSDDWAFDALLMPLAEKIIRKMLANSESVNLEREGTENQHPEDTVKSHVLLALLEYTLRLARLSANQKGTHAEAWARTGDLFDNELKQTPNLAFWSFAGDYLLQLEYLDKSWLRTNFNLLFPTDVESEAKWIHSMEGYFASFTRLHLEVYRSLKANGSLAKALTFNFKEKRISEKVRHMIMLAYLNGLETIEDTDGLLRKILDKWDVSEIGKLIWFLWTLRDAELKDDQRALFLEFWRWCYKKIGDRRESHREILSDLCQLTAYLTENPLTEEQKEWIVASAPFVDLCHHSTFFVEYLNLIADRDPKGVADIYLAMLTQTAPDFEADHIRSTVTKIYQANLKEMGNQICSEFARHRKLELLKDIREKYNR